MESAQTRAIGLNDLAQLTLRANVVFAVRCAHRVRPSFKLPADILLPSEKMAAVDAAIRVAAAFCMGVPEEGGQAAAVAHAAGVVAEETCQYTNFAGYAAVRAAEAAAYAEEVVRNPSESGIIEVVAAAFGAGRVLAANADAFSINLVAAALRADVDKLVSLAHGTNEDLGPPVDPSENGPLGALWPAGVPMCFAS